jgi:uncharacterized protein
MKYVDPPVESSAMFHAITESDNARVRDLLVKHPNLGDAQFLGYKSLLMYAASLGNFDASAALIANGAHVNRADDPPLCETALSLAALKGDANVVKLLLENGATVDGVDGTSVSPLMLAAREGHLDVVRCLLDAGAEVNRLGCVQRFFPVDFSGWHQSIEVEKLLRSRSGISVTDDYDWEHQKGFPIIAHVSNNAGAVYPLAFTRTVRNQEFAFRLAEVRAKDKPLFLFSAGLYEFGQRIELAVALHTRWPLRQTYLSEKSKFSFPLDVLQKLACFVAEGLSIAPGSMFSRDDPKLVDLSWPDGVAALVAIDHIWPVDKKSAAAEMSPEQNDDVKILALAPVLAAAKPIQDENAALRWAEKMRTASWAKITVPLSY